MDNITLDEAVDILMKAQEIMSDKEFMKEVEPAMEEKIASMKKAIQFSDLRKLASDKALEEQNQAEDIASSYFGHDMQLGEKLDKKDNLKISEKA